MAVDDCGRVGRLVVTLNVLFDEGSISSSSTATRLLIEHGRRRGARGRARGRNDERSGSRSV